MKNLCILLLGLFCYSYSHAQAALLALIFGDKIASEKFHLSVDAGLNLSSMPGLQQQKLMHGLYFGLGTFIKINDKWALTPEFKPLSPRGAKKVLPLSDYSSTLTDVQYDIGLKYIDVPVLVQYKVTPRLFVSSGPQCSFLTSAKQISSGKLASGNSVDIQENLKPRFEPVYFSWPLEVGYSFSNLHKGKGMDIKFRYDLGLSNLMKSSDYGNSKGSTFHIFLSFPFVTQAEEAKSIK